MNTPLRAARLRKGLTITHVAQQVKCDMGNLSRMERGKQRPSLELAERMVIFFAGDLSELQVLYPERFKD